MSLTVAVAHRPSQINQDPPKAVNLCNATVLKISLLVFAVLLGVAAIATYLLGVNAIVVWILTGAAAFFVLADITLLLAQCLGCSKNKEYPSPQSPQVRKAQSVTQPTIPSTPKNAKKVGGKPTPAHIPQRPHQRPRGEPVTNVNAQQPTSTAPVKAIGEESNSRQPVFYFSILEGACPAATDCIATIFPQSRPLNPDAIAQNDQIVYFIFFCTRAAQILGEQKTLVEQQMAKAGKPAIFVFVHDESQKTTWYSWELKRHLKSCKFKLPSDDEIPEETSEAAPLGIYTKYKKVGIVDPMNPTQNRYGDYTYIGYHYDIIEPETLKKNLSQAMTHRTS